jgi:hypothetical protein
MDGQINHGFWTRTRQNSFIAPISDTDEEVSFTQGAGMDDDQAWIDQSALLPLHAVAGGKRRILNMKQNMGGSSLRSTPRSSVTEGSEDPEPGMYRISKSNI